MGLIFFNHPLNTFGERKRQKAPWADHFWLDLSIYGQNLQYLKFPNRSFFEKNLKKPKNRPQGPGGGGSNFIFFP